MMNDGNLVYALAIATLIAALVIGAIQILKVRKAKQNHTHSAMTEGHPGARDEPTPRVTPRP